MQIKDLSKVLQESDEAHGTYTLIYNGTKVIGCKCLCGYKVVNSNHDVRRTLRKQHRAKMAAKAVLDLESRT